MLIPGKIYKLDVSANKFKIPKFGCNIFGYEVSPTVFFIEKVDNNYGVWYKLLKKMKFFISQITK